MSAARKPNIVISGTPGTGKTTLATKLLGRLEGYELVNLGKEAERYAEAHPEQRIRKWHAQSNSYEIDEDKLVDYLEPRMERGGNIVDWIHADFWSNECRIDLVVTLRSNNELLYDRYEARGYSQAKIDENIDAEIFGSIAEENRDYYTGEDAEVEAEHMELQSNIREEMEENVVAIVDWVTRMMQKSTETEAAKSNGSKT